MLLVDLANIYERLVSLAEELDDIGFEALRTAAEAGSSEQERKQAKLLGSARRNVLKAADTVQSCLALNSQD